MAISHWRLRPVINKKIFYISVNKLGKEPEEVIPSSGARSLFIGTGKNCDIIASIPLLPARHSILKRSISGYNLVVPPSASLFITIGDSTIPIKSLVDLGLLKKKGDFYLFPIPDKAPCTVKSDDVILTFGYKEKPQHVKKPLAKVDSSLKKHFVKKEDYAFIAILVTVYIFGTSFAAYINSMKITKKESAQIIKEMPQRFAKLVMEAPKKVAPKNIGKGMTTSGEGKSETKTEGTPVEAAKDTRETKESKEIKETKKSARAEPSAAVEVASAGSSAAVVSGGGGGSRGSGSGGGGGGSGSGSGSVKSRGLLGVIMAKSKPPEFLNQDMFSEAEDTGRAAASGARSSRSGSQMATSEVLSDIVTAKNQGGGTGGGFGSGIGSGSGGGGEGDGDGGGFGTGIGTGEGPGVPKGGKQRAADIIKEKKDIIVAEIEKEKPQKRDAETTANLRKRDESEIYKTIISYVGGLKYLYNNALRKDSTLKGKISAKIIVAQDGKVREATLVSSTLNSKELEEAILSRILKWKFPELLGGDEFSITYTFDFSPVG